MYPPVWQPETRPLDGVAEREPEVGAHTPADRRCDERRRVREQREERVAGALRQSRDERCGEAEREASHQTSTSRRAPSSSATVSARRDRFTDQASIARG